MVSQVSDPGGRTVRYTYDTAKNLTQVTDVGAKVWQFAYDAKHRMTSMTNPRGAKTTNVYDARDRVTTQTDPLGHRATWAYGADETKVTDPLGHVTYERFRSNLLVEIMGAHNTSAETVTRMDYDAQANLVKTTDPNGRAWSYAYDAQGNVTKATDPLGRSTAYAYDAKRNVTALTLASGRVASYGYDARSNLVSIKRPHSETGQTQAMALAYDGLGQLSAVTDPLDRTWRYGYNAQGDQTSATSPAGRKTTSSYDQHSWLVSSVSARGNVSGADPAAFRTSYTRDAYGRETAVRDPLGKSMTMVYDAVGNVTDTTDRDGRLTRSAYDLADRPTQVTRGDGSVLKTAYDALGQVASQTDGLGRTTSYTRDQLGRVTASSDPLGRKTTSVYDRGGRRTSLRDPAGRTTAYGYDDADRLTSMRYSSGTPTDSTFTYDVDGRLTAMTDATGRSTYSYDSLGRMVASTNPRGQKLGYGYDLGDQITSLAYPQALTALNKTTGAGLVPVATGTVRRGYDQDGHLTSVADWLGNTTRFGYDADGNLARTERPNNTQATRTTDPNGLVTDLADTATASTVLQAATPRSDAGLLASTSESGAAGAPAQRFGYDGAQRLSAAGPDATRNYAYDAADNPTTLPGGTTQTFDAANQLTTITAADGTQTTLTYDSEGNRRSSNESVTTNSGVDGGVQDPDMGTSSRYGYDQADQLTSYQGPDHARPGKVATAQYAYDATGLRQTKTVNNSQTTQTWDRSGPMPVVLTDGPTAYITGPDGKPIQQTLQDDTVRYYHHDAHGSTRALTNQTASVVAKYTYDAHGNPTSPPTTAENPFTYDSQYTDRETGLQYLRARYYDPTTAQFLTRDPITAQTRAPYTYANNNPTNYSDPTGLISIGDIGGALLDAGQAAGEGAVGAADGASFGVASRALGAVGVNVNRCSTLYRIGNNAPIPSPLKVANTGAKVVRLGAQSMRGKKRLKFDPRAAGDHTTFRRGHDGRVTHYQDWHRNPRNPNGFDPGRRFDGPGRAHGGVPTPHLHGHDDGISGRGDMDPRDLPPGW
ncbi:MAG: polymorphic toxin type 24 domain-containing protein [Solirubrobacteraceae bacterium MAG38_C4-C5]|nr:polymorphic toxin type 24 domain-containing protein [Candidatus Siliceabacter maunaloa]